MVDYGAGAWCASNLPVAVCRFCALFPEMNVALESCLDTPTTSITSTQLGRQPAAPVSGFEKQAALASGLEYARLRLLRQHDRTRTWNSVREKRICMLCGCEFEGVQIRLSVRAGKPVFGCPEPGCRGSLPHFAACGNPLLDDEAWSDWMRPTCEPTVQDGCEEGV
jgi:hypothetical protein